MSSNKRRAGLSWPNLLISLVVGLGLLSSLGRGDRSSRGNRAAGHGGGYQPRRSIKNAYTLALVFALGLTAMAVFAFGRNVADLRPFTQAPDRATDVATADSIAMAERGIFPGRSGEEGVIRAIAVHRQEIYLWLNGRVIARRPYPGPGATLPDLAEAADKPTWLKCSVGVCSVRAALVVHDGIRLAIQPPTVSSVRLANAPGVFLGVRGPGAHLELNRVRVSAVGQPGWPYRAFVVAQRGAQLNVRHSVLSGLGWDWNESYGVSWMAGAKGGATASTFRDGFIGAYTHDAQGLGFRRNRFVGNQLYGFDRHTGTGDLLLTGSLASGNGSHGIILSDRVRDSRVVYNVARDNQGNGIVLDKRSSGNRVYRNQSIGNQGDGITIQDRSHRNLVLWNVLRDNRVGVHTRSGSVGNHVSGNRLIGNDRAFQGTRYVGNIQHGNGGQWYRDRIIKILAAGALLLVLLFVLTIIIVNVRRHKTLTPA